MTFSKKLTAAVTALAAVLSSAVSCSGDKKVGQADPTAETTTLTEKGTSGSSKKAAPSEDMNITWLSDFDLNPVNGSGRSTALALFEDVYGGKINYINAQYKDRFDVLDSKLAAGEGIDMFPYDTDVFPQGVLSERFDPLDPYYDDMGMSDGLWDEMSDVIRSFEYKGQHYVVPYALSEPFLLTYSRKLMQSEGIDDPYTLYKAGSWNWDTFMQIVDKFRANQPDAPRYGINGWFGEAALCSAGAAVVTYDGTSFANNINDPKLEKAENFMHDIAAKGLYDKTWKGNFPTDLNTLFYAMNDWALAESNRLNPEADLMVVPFPKAPDADKYYGSCKFNARMLVKGSTKGAAVATYIKCERLAATDGKIRAAAKDAAIAQGITAEQFDAIQEYLSPVNITPFFDYSYGMGEKMYSAGNYNYETRGVINNINSVLLDGGPVDSWEALRGAMSGIIDGEINNYN
ncbi:MAG: ABC transporter substrate-binding protein [Ruminococcus sp.]|uniref:ABC transporter substrate-binding protein n=1 Tax=Ruminococcus sp. TaxID=41978 RepID=UPI0025D95803|nr:ABC transporter substrate-binding protein [Ruminococcus sp.]MCR5599510.1 ABC transporter substrate-binding protein [Ruminococcus sp.]